MTRMVSFVAKMSIMWTPGKRWKCWRVRVWWNQSVFRTSIRNKSHDCSKLLPSNPSSIRSKFTHISLRKSWLTSADKDSFTAYAPLCSPNSTATTAEQKAKHDLLQDPVVKKIAEKYKKNARQVLLRFAVDRNYSFILEFRNTTDYQFYSFFILDRILLDFTFHCFWLSII
jgi:hypothetical protein